VVINQSIKQSINQSTNQSINCQRPRWSSYLCSSTTWAGATGWLSTIYL